MPVAVGDPVVRQAGAGEVEAAGAELADPVADEGAPVGADDEVELVLLVRVPAAEIARPAVLQIAQAVASRGDDLYLRVEGHGRSLFLPLAVLSAALAQDIAPVHADGLGRHVGRLRPGQEDGGAGDILRAAHGPQRHLFADKALLLALGPAF